MKFNTNKILAEWAYRVDDGQPDVTNVDHVNHLREVLYNFGLPHKFIVEYVHGLTEANKAGQTWQTKSGKWAGWKAGEKRAQYGMKTGKEAQAYVAGKTTATSTDSKGKDKKPEKKYPKTAQDKQWTGDTPDNIADKVSSTGAPKVSPISDPVDINNRLVEYRGGVFSGEIVGKGGTTTTAQEEMANISREIAYSPDFKEPPSLSKQLEVLVKEKYPNSPFFDKFADLAKVSSAGARTVANMKRNKKIKFSETQPEGYPVNTTDNIVVRDLLVTKLKEAETSGDSESASHYRNELYFYQKKATDKSVTGKEGDADTMVIYKDDDGNDRILYITNKQGVGDQMSSSTLNGTLISIEKHAGTHFEPENAEKGAKTVMAIATKQHKKAESFNESYASNIHDVAKDSESRQQLSEISNALGKAFSVDWGQSGKKEYQTRNEKRALKYSDQAVDAPEVQAALLGLDPYSGDTESKEYNKWKKSVKDGWKNKEGDFTPEEVAQATIDATGTGNLTSVGSGKATSATYSLIKATQVTFAIRTKVNSALEKNGGDMDAAISSVLNQTNKKGEPLFGGVFEAEDVKQVMANKALEKLEQSERQRGTDIEGMYNETTAQLAEEDRKMGIEGVPPKNGPHTKSYVNGFLDRVHLSDYVSGDVDGKVIGEYGNNSVTPTHFRKALAQLTEFEGDFEDHEALRKHLLENIIPTSNKQQLVYVNKNNERIVIGTDTHRTGGRASKVAGQLGVTLQKLLIEIAKSETE